MSFSHNEDSEITPKSDKINTNIKIICKCIHKHNKVSMTIKSYMVQTCYIHVENLNAYTILNFKKIPFNTMVYMNQHDIKLFTENVCILRNSSKFFSPLSLSMCILQDIKNRYFMQNLPVSTWFENP